MKHVLILGGSSDIGFKVISIFLKMNWSVTAHYFKNKNRLVFLQKKNKNLNLIMSDFSKINSLNINKIVKKKFHANYDSIINLVGYIDNKSFKNTNLKSILSSLMINALIPTFIIRNIINLMLKKKWGRIVNCTTIGIKFGGGEFSYNYNLAKHCLEFIPNKFKFWAKNNVLINNIRIGHTKTKIHKRMKKPLKGNKRIKLIPMNRMAEASEIANYIVYLASDKNSYMTGQTVSISGGE